MSGQEGKGTEEMRIGEELSGWERTDVVNGLTGRERADVNKLIDGLTEWKKGLMERGLR